MNHSQHQTVRVLSMAACLSALMFVGGCSCWKDPLGQNNNANNNQTTKKPTLEEMQAQREKLLQEEDKKPDFETVRLAVLPTDDAPTRNQVKPGHWFNAVQTMKANNFDFPKGELESQCVDQKGTAIPLPGTEFDMSTTRPVNLPKGQAKHFDLLLFANKPRKGGINFITRLRPKGGGREVDWKYEATTRMKKFQNHMVVLSDQPDNYQFVKALRSIKPQRASDDFLTVELDYFLKLPKGTRRIDVPSHPLAWSNTAYVLWDDFDPEIMTAEQQQAMIDWLHWGGQLIINGPRTLDRLKSSQFAGLLPATSGEVGSLADTQIDELNDYWGFESDDEIKLLYPEEEDDRPLALKLKLNDGAHFVANTANLVAEKRVGRGRVVATAFNLPHPYFVKWDSYDCFFNACLLGRPARRFNQDGGGIAERWRAPMTRDDPRVTTGVRYFSRDALALTTRTRRTRAQQKNRDQLTQNSQIVRSRSNFPLRAVSDQSQVRPMQSMPVTHPGMPARSTAGSGVEIAIQGSEIIEAGKEATYYVRFHNTGNTPIMDGKVIFDADVDLKPIRSTGGFQADLDSHQLVWQLNPILPGCGNTIEVVCRSSDDPSRSEVELNVAFNSDQADDEYEFVVDIGTHDNKHQLARAAREAYGVNGFRASDNIGVAGWDDQSDISQEARKSLQRSAGISVPSVDFIAKVLGVYLLILVPLNWIIFKLMGRVEWAWAAVPVIAIGGALGVLQAAQLDIGFARSRTEIAIVEIQPNYNRAHVTRYIGFYTSLASNYQVAGEDASTLIQPLASSQPVGDRKVSLHQDNNIRLSGFSVISNSTGLVHSEQMLDVGGPIAFVDNMKGVRNDSNYGMKGAAIVRRDDEGQLQVAWVGDIDKNEVIGDLTFVDLDTANLEFAAWEEYTSTSLAMVEGELNIRRLMEIATDPKRIGPGEAVFVGWSDEVLPGITVTPDATQVTAKTLFVAQLSHANRPQPTKDSNSFAAMFRKLKKDGGNNDFFR